MAPVPIAWIFLCMQFRIWYGNTFLGTMCSNTLVVVYFCQFFVLFEVLFSVSQVVYPETKGISLENMDCVFGEGIYHHHSQEAGRTLIPNIDR